MYFTAEEEGEEEPCSIAVVYGGEPIQVEDYFAQKSFSLSVGFVLGARSYVTNEVSVPLDPASDVWLNLPPKPDIPAYQQLVNLAEAAAVSASNAINVSTAAAQNADYAVTLAREAIENAGVSEDRVLELIWEHAPDTGVSEERVLDLIEEHSPEPGVSEERVLELIRAEMVLDFSAMDAIIGKAIDSADGSMSINWSAMDSVIGINSAASQNTVTETQMQTYVTKRLEEYANRTEMEAYVQNYVATLLASIGIAEEGAY